MTIPLYNSRIVDTYIRLIKSHYGHIDVNALLEYCGMKAYEVADQGHWFTQDQVNRLHERLVQLSGNDQIALEAGRYAASPEALGTVKQFTLSLIGPAQAFGMINKTASNLSRSSSYEARRVSANSVEIIVTPHEGVTEQPFQCVNRIGFFESVVKIFGYTPPRIEHHECMFKGAKACRYTITWKSPRSLTLKRVGAVAALLVACVSMVLGSAGEWELLKSLLYLSVPIALLLTAIIATIEKNELKATLNSANVTTNRLLEQIDSNFNNALLINEIGQVLNNCTHIDDILALVIKVMKNRLDFDRGLIFLANQEKTRLVMQTEFCYSPEQRDLFDSVSFRLDRPESKGIFVVSFREQRPFIINDINEIEGDLSPQSREFLKRVGTRSFICCPIVSEDKSIGLLAVDNLTTKRELVASDVSRLMGIASVIGIGLRNMELIEGKIQHEKEQLKIDKLESLGILAGGIAHDFNNILTVIVGNISVAQLFIDASHKSYKPLVEADKATGRAGELAHQLLTFARGGEPVKKVFSVQHLVNETLSLVLHGASIKAITDIPDSIHAIEADEGQISQVFHNIVINAVQAMPGGGILSVTAQNVTINDTSALSLPAGRYVCLRFADQGCGISDDNLKRIFDPYFTTKSTGNGLGLASVHSIIARHGGHIEASSAEGRGTTFTIHLPSIGETYSDYQTVAEPQTTGDHPGGSVLVMDDEEMIRNMATFMLEYLGYRVTACENGSEAIAKFTAAWQSGHPFSATIMDLTIPGGMGGKEAAEHILSIDPKACLIVSSGYSNDPIMSDYRTYGFNGAVAKPYKIKELGQLLGSLLRKKPA